MITSHVSDIHGGSPLRILGPGYQGRAQTTRASNALTTAFIPTPSVVSLPSDTTRYTYDVPTKVNYVRNPRGEGGVVGSPGTSPTFWSHSGLNTAATGSGLTLQNLGSVQEGVLSGQRYRLSGTSTSVSSGSISLESSLPVTQNQTWSMSVWTRVVAGSAANLSIFYLRARYLTAGFTQTVGTDSFFPRNDATAMSKLTRYTTTTTIPADGANVTTQAAFLYQVNWNASQVIDVTFDIMHPQMELASSISAPILPPVGSPAISYVPQPRGVLIEPARTNLFTNPRMEGGAVGTTPTGMVLSSANGVSATIVGVGVESGLNYIDMRVTGTASANAAPNIQLGPAISVSDGETFAFSFYAKLIAGSMAGFRNVSCTSFLYTDVNAVTAVPSVPFVPTNQPLGNQRQMVTATPSGGTVRCFNQFRTTVDTGNTVEATFRVALPQFEKGAYPTSPILPTAGTLAASTRARDTIVYPLTSQTGVIALGYILNATNQLSGFGILGIDDGTLNNGIMVFNDISSTTIVGKTILNGTASPNVNIMTSAVTGTRYGVAVRWSPAGVYAMAKNGIEVYLGPMPTGVAFLRIGNVDSQNSMPLNGEITSVDHYPGTTPLAIVLRKIT